MDNANSILLNRFFTRSTFKQIIDDGESPAYIAAIRRYIVDSTEKTNEECISEIYQYLKNKYQNEYYYKNTLLNKLLLGVHSPRTTTALTEVPVSNSKADFILINGKAVVYEIKTALDNFDRLDGQIEDYYKAFSRVVVVTSENNFDEVQQRLRNTPVGICVLTKKGTLSVRKKPVEYNDMLSKTIMFKILRKNEYEQILLKLIGSLPSVSQFEYYRACQKLFESLPTDTAYQMFIQTLKLRMKIDIVEYSKVPYELKFLIYFSNYKKSDYAKLCHFLST
nr:sce7726 family protein [uncultured Blautia sp.]